MGGRALAVHIGQALLLLGWLGCGEAVRQGVRMHGGGHTRSCTAGQAFGSAASRAGDAGPGAACNPASPDTHTHPPPTHPPSHTWMSKSSCTCGATSAAAFSRSMSASAVLRRRRGQGAASRAGGGSGGDGGAALHAGKPSPAHSPAPGSAQPAAQPPPIINPPRPAASTHPIIISLLPGLSARSATVSASVAGRPPARAFRPSSFMRFSDTEVAASSLRFRPCA